jgi:hypothetical protein
MAPRGINRAESGAVVYLWADEIERIDLTGVLSNPRVEGESLEVNEDQLLTELTAALDRMRVLTLRSKPVALAIQSAGAGPASNPGRLFVRVNELVNGIRVEPDGLFIVDASTGRIQSFSLPSVADAASTGGDPHLWLTKEQAVALARKAVVSEHGGPLPDVVEEPELRYKLERETLLTPEWRVTLRNDTTPYGAVVNALTGETSTHSLVIQ